MLAGLLQGIRDIGNPPVQASMIKMGNSTLLKWVNTVRNGKSCDLSYHFISDKAKIGTCPTYRS